MLDGEEKSREEWLKLIDEALRQCEEEEKQKLLDQKNN